MSVVIFARASGLAGACLAAPAFAALQPVADLADLSLEQLSKIVVTSASRRAEPLVQAPASIFVITADDIRRSGATSLAEALRLAPNLHVARADTNQYAISARGFNNTLANKMLVLIDGRTIYTPLFSGVFWDAQDVMLEDVERIEVISGPAATLWGSNGVSGVINITTLPAARTQGTLVAGGAGNLESGAMARHGGTLGADGHYRVYAKYFDRRHGSLEDGTAIRDESERALVGFRADWDRARDRVSLLAHGHHGTIDMAPAGRSIQGGSFIGRWTRRLADEAGLRFQAYYDRQEREHRAIFGQKRDTFDAELQHDSRPWEAHHLVWGAGYRFSRDRVENFPSQAFLPARRDLRWSNVFLQDDIRLRPGLFLTLGAKVEHNPYTGEEFLPNARLAWQGGGQLVWASLSRAVRAPSRIDRDFYIPGQAPFFLVGNESFQSEVAEVVEVGYRAQLTQLASISVTAFHHDFDKLRSVEPIGGGALSLANDIEGRLRGLEGWGSYRFGPTWRLSGGFVAQRLRLKVKEGQVDQGGLAGLGNDPRHHWHLRSSWDLPANLEADLIVRRVGSLPNPRVPAYTAVDGRVAWKASPSLVVSIAFQNLLDEGHVEWGVPGNRYESERGFFVKVLWRI